MTSQGLVNDLREELGRADAKASTLLASFGIVLGALMAGLLANSWGPASLGGWQWVWWPGALIALVAPCLLAACVYPRFSNREPAGGSEIVYFGDVVGLTRDQVARAIADLDESKSGEVDLVYHLGRIVHRKYMLLRYGIQAMGIGLLLCLVSLGLHAIFE